MARRRAQRGHSASGEAGAGRALLTAASRGATPTARSVTCALPGPASLPATRRARRLPTVPGPCDPGKRSHTCAQHLRPALAKGARREKGPRAAKFVPKNEVGRCFSSRGQERARSGLDAEAKDGSGRRFAGRGTALSGPGSGAREWPWKACRVTRVLGQKPRELGVRGGRWEGAEPTPPAPYPGPRLSLRSEASGQLQPGEQRPPASCTEQLDSRFFFFFFSLRGGGLHLGQRECPLVDC